MDFHWRPGSHSGPGRHCRSSIDNDDPRRSAAGYDRPGCSSSPDVTSTSGLDTRPAQPPEPGAAPSSGLRSDPEPGPGADPGPDPRGEAPLDSRPASALDVWLELATGQEPAAGQGESGDADPSPPAEPDPGLAPDLVADVERLLEVLDDHPVGLKPPTAADLTDEAWSQLDPIRRRSYARRQLGRLDPRLIPRAVSRWARRHRRNRPRC